MDALHGPFVESPMRGMTFSELEAWRDGYALEIAEHKGCNVVVFSQTG
jgi:hypothetical protein